MLDLALVILYLLATLAIGFLAGRKTKTFSDFAIGKRNISTFALLAAIMASIVDASETIDYASEVLNQGLIYCLAYLGAGFSSLGLSFFFARRFERFLGGTYSTGDVIQYFFGARAKTVIGIATLIETILFCGTQILAISITIRYFFGISGDLASIIVSLITLLYFFRGGARSVNATDIFQFGILIVVLPIFCGIALSNIGGLSTIFSFIHEKGLNFTTSEPASYGTSLAMLILFSLPGQYPLVIQRMLMAKNILQLQKVLLFDAFVGTFLRIVIITIGITGFILLPSVGSSAIFFDLANYLLPIGLKGLIIVGLLAIMMSTIDSTIHLGAVALTHDVFGTIFTKDDEDEKKLKFARYSSLLIIVGAIITSFSFDKVGNLFYLLMALGNCLIWPNIFLGLTGISASKTGFWCSVITGISTIILSIVYFNIDFLYLNLIATFASLLAHLACIINTKKISCYVNNAIQNLKNISTNFTIKDVKFVKNMDYCNIFCILSIFLSIYPFFTSNKISYMYVSYSIITGLLAVFILFSEFWPRILIRFYSALWGILIVVTLPAHTYFMLIYTKYSEIWILDAILIIPLITIITTKKSAILLYISGVVLAIFGTLNIHFVFSDTSINLGYCSVLIHSIILTLCFALFRKRDVEICRFTTATLIHEANRALSTFELSAQYYQKRMPRLISQYRIAPLPNDQAISASELDTMLELPDEIKKLSQRTRTFLKKFHDQISSYSGNRKFTDIHIKECILAATSDSSLDQDLRQYIQFDENTDLVVKGDFEQMIQVFINLLENAGHALKSTTNPHISITILGQTVFITDNGKGIDPSDMPNIFDELFSTKSTSGQGLAFCKRVMIEHGGTILCSSKKNHFTRFELRFPDKY